MRACRGARLGPCFAIQSRKTDGSPDRASTLAEVSNSKKSSSSPSSASGSDGVASLMATATSMRVGDCGLNAGADLWHGPGAFRHQQAHAKGQERRTKILSSIAGVAAGRTYRPPLMMGRTRTRARISSTDTIAPFSKSVRQCDFPFFCSPRRVAERLKNVFTLQVGVRGQHLLYGVTRADELDDCADRHAHGTYRGLAAHEVGIVGDSVEVRHGVTLTQGPRTVDRYPPQPFQTAEPKRGGSYRSCPRAGARRPARRERLPPRGTGSAPGSTHSSPFGLMILAASAGRTSHDTLQIRFELRTWCGCLDEPVVQRVSPQSCPYLWTAHWIPRSTIC